MSGPGNEQSTLRDPQGKAIPYQLVDTGDFDVWLMTARGAVESRDHMWYDPDGDAEFWNFSFDEISRYDMQAAMEFILNDRNDDKKITVIGYSQGTTIATAAIA